MVGVNVSFCEVFLHQHCYFLFVKMFSEMLTQDLVNGG